MFVCLLPSDFSAVPAIFAGRIRRGRCPHRPDRRQAAIVFFLLLPAPKIVSGFAGGLALRPIGRERGLDHLGAAVADPSGIARLPAALLVHRLASFLVVFYPVSRRPLPAWRPSLPWPGHPPGSLELLLLSGTCHHILCRFGSRLLHHGIDRTLA